MKMFLICILFFISSCTDQTKKVSESYSFSVEKDIKVNLRNKARGITGSYWIKDSGCKLKWTYSISSSKNEKNINLELVDSGLGKECENDLGTFLDMHSAILSKFNEEYNSNKINKVKIRGLRSIDPLKRCNKEMATFSSKSSLYQDYREKYPKHDSKLSINEIFKRVMVENNICEKFFILLKAKGLPVTITSVERVFTHKSERLKKYFVDTKGLSSRIMWDAGYLYLKDK